MLRYDGIKVFLAFLHLTAAAAATSFLPSPLFDVKPASISSGGGGSSSSSFSLTAGLFSSFSFFPLQQQQPRPHHSLRPRRRRRRCFPFPRLLVACFPERARHVHPVLLLKKERERRERGDSPTRTAAKNPPHSRRCRERESTCGVCVGSKSIPFGSTCVWCVRTMVTVKFGFLVSLSLVLI